MAPPPVDDAEQNARTAGLDEHFADICAAAAAPYVRVHHPLRDSAVWMREVRAGDGAHPGAAGYQEMAALIGPRWREWLAR
ncbi:GDSL-type esterase/lipase family protein [Nocardia sp. NPDC051990]|uniref:GDSL-type esterase/lipase family protein n=1 Tax=Nocardia sp. NPDC051990 TaxID=3155285 RepID=UPI00341C41E5